jgi:hypothetical protein
MRMRLRISLQKTDIMGVHCCRARYGVHLLKTLLRVVISSLIFFVTLSLWYAILYHVKFVVCT